MLKIDEVGMNDIIYCDSETGITGVDKNSRWRLGSHVVKLGEKNKMQIIDIENKHLIRNLTIDDIEKNFSIEAKSKAKETNKISINIDINKMPYEFDIKLKFGCKIEDLREFTKIIGNHLEDMVNELRKTDIKYNLKTEVCPGGENK